MNDLRDYINMNSKNKSFQIPAPPKVYKRLFCYTPNYQYKKTQQDKIRKYIQSFKYSLLQDWNCKLVMEHSHKMIVSLLLLVAIATVGNCLPLRKSRQIDETQISQENLEGGLNATVYLLVSIRYRIYIILYYYSICFCLFTCTLIMKQ